MTVAELQERMDSREISEWMAFERIEPQDLWQSTIARLLYWVGCQWCSKPPSFSSFLPSTKAKGVEQTPAEMRARLRGL